MSEIFYRYEHRWEGVPEDCECPLEIDVVVRLREYHVIKRTPCGVWLRIGQTRKKWTNTTGKKRYAHESKRDALDAFIARRQRELDILDHRREVSKSALFAAKRKADELLSTGVARTRFQGE